MFHMIEKPVEFLSKLYRILKLDGTVILEDGYSQIEIAKYLRLSK